MDEVLNVVILGAGNVGTHLAHILKEKGFLISEIYSRNPMHAQELAAKIGCEYCDNLQDLNTEADIYIFAVKDDVLDELAAHIYLPGKIVVHTSGAAETNKLQKISDNFGVFYPLQTFSKSRPVNWNEIPLCIEAGNKETLDQLQQLAIRISGKVLKTSYEQRRNLHVAAVFVSNFTNHLLQNAYMLMQKNALPFDILKPLAIETVEKAFAIEPQNAQTGPAIRSDEKTIEAHEKLLDGQPEILQLYKEITRSIQLLHQNHS
ncbi:MAG: Rossmann-like and DUF2520 domain-containing protein [Bacteroidia bacterium]